MNERNAAVSKYNVMLPRDVLRLLTGKMTLNEGRGRRVHYDGDPKLLRRFGAGP